MTVKEVAAALRVHRYTVQRWLREGKLKGRRLGGTKAGWRVAEGEVDKLGREEGIREAGSL